MSAPKLRFKEFDGEWNIVKLKNCIASIDSGWSPQCDSYPADLNEWGVLKTTSVDWSGFKESANKRLPDNLKPRLEIEVKPDDILVTRAGPTERVGVVSVVPKGVRSHLLISDKLIRLKNNKQNDPKFLGITLASSRCQNQLQSKTSGLAKSQTNISQKILLEVSLQTPAKEEQMKIATFLSAVDEKIAQLSQKRHLLGQYKQGMMQKLFSQKIRFKADDGSEFGEWKLISIKEAVSFIKDGTHGTHQDDQNSELFLLSAKNLQNGRIKIDERDRKINQKEFDSIYKNYTLEAGDILLSVVGTIGRVAIFKENYKAYAFQRSVAFMRFKESLPEFIYQLFLANDFQNELLVRQVVSAQPGIYLGDLSKIEISLPCLDEQTKIANFLSAIDQKIDVVSTQLKQAKIWKKGLLQQMFV